MTLVTMYKLDGSVIYVNPDFVKWIDPEPNGIFKIGLGNGETIRVAGEGIISKLEGRS